MFIILNPEKARQFTTKGIHLTMLKPAMEVPEDLEGEFLDKINRAIRDEVLLVADDITKTGLISSHLKGELSMVSDEGEFNNVIPKRIIRV